MAGDPYRQGNAALRGLRGDPQPPQPAGGNLFDSGYKLQPAPGYGSPDESAFADSTTAMSPMGSPHQQPAWQHSVPTPGGRGGTASRVSPPRVRGRVDVESEPGSPMSQSSSLRGLPRYESRGAEGRRQAYERRSRGATASESLMAEEKAERSKRSADWCVAAGLLAGGLVVGATAGGVLGWAIGKLCYGAPGYYATHSATVGTAGALPGMTQAAATATHAASHAASAEATTAAVTSMVVPPSGVAAPAAAVSAAHTAAAANAVTAATASFEAAGSVAVTAPAVVYSSGVGAGCIASGAAVGGAGGAVAGVAVADNRRRRQALRGDPLPPPIRGEASRSP
eukprot:TRINITY_DN60014_c0_g1_i1.p1 TRINITY_DN60014_c0_g1~~TRINITY_DN60014_c0_g1_i1.p1  ORF type:complete len:367 (+),score=41.53 TRINITY_DN60014_c0_g1_i1:84-1103(+)